MNLLIIYAHPNHESLSYGILETLQDNLSSSHTIKTIDLYDINFNPNLVFNKEKPRRHLKNDEETKAYRDLISWSEKIIFIFPIWWGGMPAILKGFIDRVFVKGYAYEYKGIAPVPLLPGKTGWIITTHDTPGLYARLFQQDYGKILQKQVLKMCGIKPVKYTVLPFTRRKSEEKRLAFLKKISMIAQSI